MNFADRPPSVAWEFVVVPSLPGGAVWVWFKPSHAPQNLLIQVPDETYRTCGAALTLRLIVAAAGMDPVQVLSWTVQGVTYDAQGGVSPLLDHPIPLPGSQGIAVQMAAALPATPAMTTMPPHPAVEMPVSSMAATGDTLTTFEAIDGEWNSIIQIERQLEAIRRKLGDIQGQLGSLNRNLDSDERLYSSALDKKDWDDSRRFLRDNLAQVGRYIRAHDIGVTSTAGNRKHFEKVFEQYIEPRLTFPGMEAQQLAFEQHRKTNQTLLLQMQTTYAAAARDGVQRARMVLTRITAKVQLARNKR